MLLLYIVYVLVAKVYSQYSPSHENVQYWQNTLYWLTRSLFLVMVMAILYAASTFLQNTIDHHAKGAVSRLGFAQQCCELIMALRTLQWQMVPINYRHCSNELFDFFSWESLRFKTSLNLSLFNK